MGKLRRNGIILVQGVPALQQSSWIPRDYSGNRYKLHNILTENVLVRWQLFYLRPEETPRFRIAQCLRQI